MKKIAVLLLLILFIAGCGKKASGTLIIENKSNYDVIFGIGEDYRNYDVSIPHGETKKIAWKHYILWYPESPKNVISYTKESDKKVIITNNNHTYKYTIRSNVPSLDILDNNKYILADSSKSHKDKITIPNGESEIYCFQKIKIDDIVFDKGTEFDINGKKYNPVQKIDGIYYYNTDDSGKLKSEKINIEITDKYIMINK